MVFETSNIGIFNGSIQIGVPRGCAEQLDKLQRLIEAKKVLSIKIVEKRKHRSLDANSCMWATLNELAAKLQTTAWEVYLTELRKYGHFEYFMCVPEAVPAMEKTFRICREREKRIVGEKEMVVLQVWPGSSTYDTKQFSRLLDGVMQDAKEQGCDTYIAPQDRALLIEEMERDAQRMDKVIPKN